MAWDEAKYGRFSQRPMVDAVIPTTKDPTIAPEGKHIMTCFVQYVPYQLRDEGWENGARERLAECVIDTIGEYAPNFTSSRGRCRWISCSLSVPPLGSRATERRSRASTCAAPARTREAGSWVSLASMPPGSRSGIPGE